MTRPQAGLTPGFTTRATCLLAAGLTAVICGLVFGEVDLVRAGVLAAAVPVIAAVVVHRARVRIANRREIEPATARTGESVTVHLTITNRALLRTSSLMLEDALPDRIPGNARFVLDPLGAHEARPVSYRIPSPGRGRYRVGPLRMRVSDPFGLIDLTRSFTSTSEFVVTPVVDQLPAIDPPRSEDLGETTGSRSVGSHGADDQSTREYRTGDDLRKIHWRSSARTGSLMVRQEERPWHGQNTVLLDVRASAHSGPATAHPHDRPGAPDPAADDIRLASSFEWAVSAVASIGTQLMMSGRRLGLVADALGGSRQPFSDPLRLSRYLADVRESSRSDLVQMAQVLREASRDSTLIAVLGSVDPDALRALAEAHSRGRSVPAFAMLLDVDTWSAGVTADDAKAGVADTTGDQTPVRVAPNGAADASDVADQVPGSAQRSAAVLRNAGWRVAVVRRGDTTARAWQLMLGGGGTSAGALPDARIGALR